MPGILVFGEIAAGRLAPASLEVKSAGAALAAARGEPLYVALIGRDAGAAATGYAVGAAGAYAVEVDSGRAPAAHDMVEAAAAVCAACAPSAVLCPHTLATRDWLPRLAARLDTGLMMDCTAIGDAEGTLAVTKPVYGGALLADCIVTGSPALATVRAGVYPPAECGGKACSVTPVGLPAAADVRVSILEECASTSGAGLRLQDARSIVAGGRGVGGPDHWHYIEEAAAALGAAVGCTRPVADAGWVPSSQQVGLSGASVAPDLYVAVGISGAVQHLAGITAARVVVAINNDESADILRRASLAVVGDYRAVLPAFVKRVRQLRAGE